MTWLRDCNNVETAKAGRQEVDSMCVCVPAFVCFQLIFTVAAAAAAGGGGGTVPPGNEDQILGVMLIYKQIDLYMCSCSGWL